MQVTLADGTERDLARLDSESLYQLQFEQEREFAQRIRQSPKNSPERSEAIARGYETVCSILSELRGGDLQMGFDARYADLVLHLLHKFERRADAAPSLFEIGYGTGSLLAATAARGFAVAGIEVAPALREQALQRLPNKAHSQLYLGNFLAHDFGTQHFDVVYWNDVFEHIPPDEIGDFLAKTRQMLRPGGCLITITPNWHERPSDVTGDFAPPRTEACGLHLKEYTLGEVTALLRQTGFARVGTPLVVLPHKIVLARGGLAGLKRTVEPLLEWLPYRLARRLVHGLGLSYTIAYK